MTQIKKKQKNTQHSPKLINIPRPLSSHYGHSRSSYGNHCTDMKQYAHCFPLLGSQRVLAVSHVSVLDWPKTEPLLSGSSKLIRIFHEVQQLKQRQSKKGPVLVHCL